MKAKSSSSPPAIGDVLKSLEGLSLDDKVSTLAKRLVEAEERSSKLKERTSEVDRLTKANIALEKKLEKTNGMLLRTDEAKNKLEELCRQLQKYNKQLKDESIEKMKIIEGERQAAVEHLKVTLKDIEKSMDEGRERSDELAGENKRLANKLLELSTEYEQRLSGIADQYNKKEIYYGELGKAKDCEIKLLNAKLEAARCQSEKLLLEKEELARSLLEGSARVGSALETERTLRKEVEQYASRYEELTSSLSASNDAFDKFKAEITKVNTNLKKVEKDSRKWKQMYEEASKNVLVLTMSKKELEDNSAAVQKKNAQLEQLCRALSSRNQSKDVTDESVSSNPVVAAANETAANA